MSEWLWLKIHRQELVKHDDPDKNPFGIGHQVEAIALNIPLIRILLQVGDYNLLITIIQIRRFVLNHLVLPCNLGTIKNN